MNLAELQRKLVAAARRHPPRDAVPHAFEKRITTLIQARPAADDLAWWAGAFWRAAVACVAVVLLLGAVSFFAPRSSDSSAEMSDEFQNTLLAVVDQDTDSLQ
jgi:anti-sigma-K factor RskA